MKLKVTLVVVGILCAVTRLMGQDFNTKPSIDPLNDSGFENWKVVLGRSGISGDGKHIWYTTLTGSPFSYTKKTEIILTRPGSSFEKRFSKVFNADFSPDSKFFIYKSGDYVHCLRLSDGKVDSLKSSMSYQLIGNRIVFGQDSLITVKELNTGKTLQYSGSKYFLSEAGQLIVIQNGRSLGALCLKTDRSTQIFQSDKQTEAIDLVTIDKKGNNIAFIARKRGELVLYNYSASNNKLLELATASRVMKELGSKLISEQLSFSSDGGTIFFATESNEVRLDKSSILRIWNYRDIYERYPIYRYLTAISLNTQKFIRIEDKNTQLIEASKTDRAILSSVVNSVEIIQDSLQYKAYEIISLKDGKRRRLPDDGSRIFDPKFSPTGKFISWYDYRSKNVMLLELKTGKQINVTKGLDVKMLTKLTGRNDGDIINRTSFNLFWTKNDKCLILEDTRNIWKFDHEMDERPINLTAAFTDKKSIRLKIIESRERISSLDIKDQVLISGFDDNTGFNGLFKMSLQIGSSPIELIKPGPYLYCFPAASVMGPPLPQRAVSSSRYLIIKQSSCSSPNFEVLDMDGNRIKISNIHPEENYNWLTTELHHFKTDDGESRSGILYKPENFNPKKKYPVIFYYYEMLSSECYLYKLPGLSAGPLNIPLYVSNGYLVFVPDIWQRTGEIGKSALASVEGAAKYLKNKFSWVDGDHMGLQGHSFGGYYTNYIAMHSKMFAAAQSSAGLSDIFRKYGDIGFGGSTLTFLAEQGQTNMGGHPWNIQNSYLSNSPFYYANKCVTPLLLEHGEVDDAVNFGQARSLFIALRRLHKPVWLLEYKGQDHTLGTPESLKDFTLRQFQFFDHYLKGKPMPDWMKEGVGRF